MAYVLGRRRRNGDVSLAIAQHELKTTLKQQEAVQAKLDIIKQKQQDILVDIVAEEARRAQLLDKEVSDAEILARLRADGLIK